MFLEELRFGKPKYNLRIHLTMNSKVIEEVNRNDDSIGSYDGIHKARTLGNICNFAFERFNGLNHVTDRGYLLLDQANVVKYPSLYTQTAILDISKNEDALFSLEETLKSGNNPLFKVILEYENGQVQFVKTEGKYLYLPLEREKISDSVAALLKSQQMTNE